MEGHSSSMKDELNQIDLAVDAVNESELVKEPAVQESAGPAQAESTLEKAAVTASQQKMSGSQPP